MAANETLSDYLKRREIDLAKLAETVRARLAHRERELDQIHKVSLSVGLYTLPFMDPVSPALPLSNESLRDFLTRRNRELTQQIAAIRGELTPVETELAEIHRAQSVMTGELQVVDDAGSAAARDLGLYAQYENLTIKELIMSALSSGHFPNGAKPNDLREFFKNAYGRDIPLTSLSPQLTRMREEGLVEQPREMPNTGLWRLVPGQIGIVELSHDKPIRRI